MENKKFIHGDAKIPSYDAEYLNFKAESEDFVKLDLNENLVIDSNFMKDLLISACENTDTRLYPPPRGMLALKAISKFYGLDEEMIIVGNGLDLSLIHI